MLHNSSIKPPRYRHTSTVIHRKRHECLQYWVFSIFLLLLLSLVKIFSPAPSPDTFSMSQVWVKDTTVKQFKFNLSTPRKHKQGGEVQHYLFLTSSLDKIEGPTRRHRRFMPGTGHRYPINRRLGRPPDSLDDLGKIKISSPCRDAKPGSSNPEPSRETSYATWSFLSSFENPFLRLVLYLTLPFVSVYQYCGYFKYPSVNNQHNDDKFWITTKTSIHSPCYVHIARTVRLFLWTIRTARQDAV